MYITLRVPPANLTKQWNIPFFMKKETVDFPASYVRLLEGCDFCAAVACHLLPMFVSPEIFAPDAAAGGPLFAWEAGPMLQGSVTGPRSCGGYC